VDKDGQTVWEVKADELPGISLKFMAGLQRLPNGNTVMSNWLGHGQLGKAPHLIEITRDKRVLWTFFDHQTMTTVSSVQLLDVPGDATKGRGLALKFPAEPALIRTGARPWVEWSRRGARGCSRRRGRQSSGIEVQW
jgi:hypothetical protein